MIRIGEFTLDTERYELTRNGEVIHCEPKVLDLIVFLAQNPDRVLSRDALIEAVWGGRVVSDAAVSSCVAAARRALNDTGGQQRVIKTLHGRGFRFVGETVAQLAAVPTEVHQVTAESGPPVLAVISFSLIGTSESQQAIAEAIPTELIAALSKVHSVKVIARASAFRFKSSNVDPGEIRNQLGAGYVVSGAVELFGAEMRVFVELAETRSGQVIWSDAITGTLDEVFEIRERIADAVAAAVERHVPFNEARRHTGVPSEALDAWGLYHLGVNHLYRFNGADNTVAAGFFQKAVELDPRFARAYAGLSYTEAENFNLWAADRQRHLRNGIAMAEKAIEIDPFDPFCNLVLGRAKWIDGKSHEAMTWVDRSIELNPNYAFAYYNSAKLRAFACEADRADGLVFESIRLSPLDPHMQSMLSVRAINSFTRGDRENAINFALKSISAPNPHLLISVAAAALFHHYGADEHLERAKGTIARLNSTFSREHFLSIIALQDADLHATFVKSLDALELE